MIEAIIAAVVIRPPRLRYIARRPLHVLDAANLHLLRGITETDAAVSSTAVGILLPLLASVATMVEPSSSPSTKSGSSATTSPCICCACAARGAPRANHRDAAHQRRNALPIFHSHIRVFTMNQAPAIFIWAVSIPLAWPRICAARSHPSAAKAALRRRCQAARIDDNCAPGSVGPRLGYSYCFCRKSCKSPCSGLLIGVFT